MMLYFRMILTMLVTLYTSRIILNTLGVVDYGIYNVVGGVVALFGFFNSAMSSATQRFLSFEIGKNDFKQLRKTFNASQVIHVGIAFFIFILSETIGLWFVKTYLVIPPERLDAAIWVYHCSVLSFMVTVIQVPYNATIIAHERMNVYAYVSIFEVVLKLFIVFLLTYISYDKLKLYGILYLIVVLIIAGIYRLYTYYNFSETKFEIVNDKKLYKTLINYSAWNLFGNFSGVAKGQGVNILLNMFFGPSVNAARGISTQVQGALNGFVNNFQMAVNPQIIKSYAVGDKEYMTQLIIRSSKYSFYLLYILSLPIILEVDQILVLWLKTVPEYTPIFTVLVLVVILIDCISGPLMTAIQATGKIKVYQAVVGTLLILILPISYIYLRRGYSPEVTLYINIVIAIVALVIRLYIVMKLLEFPIIIFIKEVIIKNIAIIPLTIFIPLLVRNSMDADLTRLILVFISAFVWSFIIIYTIGLNKQEKILLLKNFNKVLKR
ncbi:MAG: MATE family efflux transporter [Tissierellia bacterium]|nr:MATE family efflux transporter [Tissierellia bacterium]